MTDQLKRDRTGPRDASTLLLFGRDQGSQEINIALLRRAQSARFLPGALVFPGGGVEEDDQAWLSGRLPEAWVELALNGHQRWGFASAHAAARSLGATLRECEEETGLRIASSLVGGIAEGDPPLSPPRCVGHWLTPEQLKVRYDTYFWAAEWLGPLPQLEADGAEIERGEWISPREAISAYHRGETELPAPTLCVLSELAELIDAGESIETLIQRLNAAAHPSPICPVLRRGDQVRLYLPGDPHYLEVRGAQPRVGSTSFWEVSAHYLERQTQRPTWVRRYEGEALSEG